MENYVTVQQQKSVLQSEFESDYKIVMHLDVAAPAQLTEYVFRVDQDGIYMASFMKSAYELWLASRSRTAVVPISPTIRHADDLAVEAFANVMKAKLAASRAKGRSGWDDRTKCSDESLSVLLREHVDKGDPVDVANFAMMHHSRGAQISKEMCF